MTDMSIAEHRREAERLAGTALDGDYMDGELQRIRYALVGLVHAVLAATASEYLR